MTLEAIQKHENFCQTRSLKLPDGPWKKEPNRLNWKYAGLDCMVVRNDSLFHWCGYVGLPPEHPAYGKSYGELEDVLDVHGGLTYGKMCSGAVCHIPLPGEPDQLFWLGFDCMHSGDISPGMLEYRNSFSILNEFETYKDMEYVKAETEKLAEQLAKFTAQSASSHTNQSGS